jgi:biotin carboxyl carrier protein
MDYQMQIIKVVVEGQEYQVEIGDLSARPVVAIVDGHAYEVYPENLKMVSEPASPRPPQAPATVKPPVSVPALSPAPESSVVTDTTRITAPMPGDVVEILVKPGEQVNTGQTVCVLEAMKMKNMIRSPRDGRIASVDVGLGQSVPFGSPLITFE